MHLDALASKFPHLWHVTFARGSALIRRYGLLPAGAVFADVGQPEQGRRHRRDPTSVSTGMGEVVLRDQLNSRANPTASLDGITAEEWWAVVNARVYFFVSAGAAGRLVESYNRRGFPQEVLKLRTAVLLRPVAEQVELTTVNAGVFPRAKGPARGPRTFLSLAEFDEALLPKVKEVTVATTVPVADAAVVSVVGHAPEAIPRRLWP